MRSFISHTILPVRGSTQSTRRGATLMTYSFPADLHGTGET
jgi:hypothetical protein